MYKFENLKVKMYGYVNGPVELEFESRHELLVVMPTDTQHDPVGQIGSPKALNFDRG